MDKFELEFIVLQIKSTHRLMDVHAIVCPGRGCPVCSSLQRQLARLHLEYEEGKAKT